ncbi:hypothetical protein AQUCO_01600068v1 [Aquilegia coerulea]|uniref:Reverse transcriptase zinc-binding domain-containing protein n=1 Tax=Aquilegia coerulea TaxID=218851 RepID=A0A2G5DQ23_AQUCA|nr:hypothetical protein AQUCO_01600068v1 [Aquilegia coerulea]
MEKTLQKRGIQLASMCCMCCKEEESLNHLLWHCNRAKDLWSWLCQLFGCNYDFEGLEQALTKGNNFSSLIRDLWNVGVLAVMVETWKGENKRLFEGERFNSYSCSYKVRWWLRAAGKLSKGTFRSNPLYRWFYP